MMDAVFREYKTGEVIFRQGDAGDCAFLIDHGRVQISVNKSGEDFPVNILGEGQIFGEMAIIDRAPRSATVTALEDTRVCVIAHDSLVGRIQGADPVVRLLMIMLVKRSRDYTESIHSIRNSKTEAVPVLLTQEAQKSVRFESEIKSAFAHSEFYMNYQPIVELKSATTVGFEALIRWQSPTLGAVSPGDFMGTIEESSIMVPVGRWIIEQAMMGARQLCKKLGSHISVNINISPKQFLDPAFVDHLERTRKSLGVKSSQIKLEITEQIFVESAVTLAVIEECRKLGYKVCLDDFGTGYSSISYLKRMNLDVLKIDQSFIRQTKLDRKSKSIIKAIVALGTDLGMVCVAEGIENQEIADALVKLGCTHGQGYLFGKPQNLDYYLNGSATIKKAA